MHIRTATLSDADDGSRILRRSIEELCHADHGGDPAVIADWVGNKTPEMWRHWVDQDSHNLYVAVEAGRLVGVDMMDVNGEIMLNYVCPDARFRGVSKALLTHMEAKAADRGVRECRLESTNTARGFYESAGYHRCAGDAADSDRLAKTLVRR